MTTSTQIKTSIGHPYPLGLSSRGTSLNFSVVSFHATRVTLSLFERKNKQLVAEIRLSPEANRTGAVWHIAITDLPDPSNYVYAYKITPPLKPEQNLLLDPYAKSMATPIEWGASSLPGYTPYASIVTDPPFDWEGDRPLKIPVNDLIIYEMHTRGFTKHPSSNVTHPGKFLGIIERIPHLLSLGINAVELMPIHEFNETEYAKTHPLVKTPLYNFWGYSTVNFFAPMNRYASSETPGSAIEDFKQMVKALHKHGIEILLDVVFNHTAEGNETGPILSFKGLDNDLYYMVDHGQYLNFTGCGNTVNANQAITLELIITSLRYWVTEMHVDGFRFDLASIFSRDRLGNPLPNTAIIRAITEDPILATTKLIAEPWDAAGLYQVGSFAGHSPRWAEWNDKYRDTIRQFLKGMPGTNGDFARRLSGSQDLYYDRGPCASINFVTAHDGFSLADLVAYNMKHNMSNGENNQDGSNHNESWNCGVEGPTKDCGVIAIRNRQMRNFHLALMVSQGVPMLLMGDEYGHTKGGNNNTWCHDDELNWFDWEALEASSHDNFKRFYIEMIKFRKQHPILRRTTFLTDNDIDWHGITPFKADWQGQHPFLAFTLRGSGNTEELYIAFNAQNQTVEATIPPPPPNKVWRWIADTGAASPGDFFVEDSGPLQTGEIITLLPYTSVILKSHSL